MNHVFWADVIAVAHLGYFLFTVLALPATWIGLWRGWGFARNLWFRGIHLLMILIVAVEAGLNWGCPVTRWEMDLRRAGGQVVSDKTFVERVVDPIMFCDLPPQVFRWAHITFFVAVLATFVFAPPRRKTTASRAEVLAPSRDR